MLADKLEDLLQSLPEELAGEGCAVVLNSAADVELEVFVGALTHRQLVQIVQLADFDETLYCEWCFNKLRGLRLLLLNPGGPFHNTAILA